MSTRVLFLQGAGTGAYAADALLAASLERSLDSTYSIVYPEMPNEEEPEYETWGARIAAELEALNDPIVLVGHSLGASILARFLSIHGLPQHVAGVFLLANPYWGGDGWRYEGYQDLELPQTIAESFAQSSNVYLYHGKKDETVPFEHLALYAARLPCATVREIDNIGHQFNNDLSVVAQDIMKLTISN